MADRLHLGDEVEFVSNSFVSEGAPEGSIGVIVDDWADGSNDVELREHTTGEVVARVRAVESDIRLLAGQPELKQPREQGLIFGRGEDLADDVEAPPLSDPWANFATPGYTPAPVAFALPPQEDVELVGEVPWELREEPPVQTGPVII